MIDLYEAQTKLADFKDPFQKECVDRVSTWCSRTYNGEWIYRGTVAFKNGNTEGEQKFDGISLADVLGKMERFIADL